MPRTHYEVLGLALDASLEDIKAAYWKIQLQHHPDRTREASATEREKSEAISKAANTAYEVLCDTTRSLYDMLLFRKQTNAFPTYTKPTSSWKWPPPTFTPSQNAPKQYTISEPDTCSPTFTVHGGGWNATISLSAACVRKNGGMDINITENHIILTAEIGKCKDCPNITTSVPDVKIDIGSTPHNCQVRSVTPLLKHTGDDGIFKSTWTIHVSLYWCSQVRLGIWKLGFNFVGTSCWPKENANWASARMFVDKMPANVYGMYDCREKVKDMLNRLAELTPMVEGIVDVGKIEGAAVGMGNVGTEKRREKVNFYRMRSEGSIYMSGVSGAFQISGVTWNDDMVEHSGSY
jgi:hypothetical protein